MSIPDFRKPQPDSVLVWDDGKSGDFLADYRRGIEMVKEEAKLPPRPLQTILSVENWDFIEKHPSSPCCDKMWLLHGFANGCPGCGHTIAGVRAKMAKGEP